MSEARDLARSRRFETAPHNCFACGQLNTHGLHLELHTQTGRCWTELRLPAHFEGWEGIAHGGIIATLLDEVMAWSLIGRDLLGVTARMSIEFRRAVPIDVPLRAEGWVVEARRRVIDTAAHIVDPATGDVLATADGRYVSPPEERRRELTERYQIRIVDDVDDTSGLVAQR